ncbi:MAG: hypothetical protein AABX89_07420 [Candidatus Thermoplasmatota archaeon]
MANGQPSPLERRYAAARRDALAALQASHDAAREPGRGNERLGEHTVVHPRRQFPTATHRVGRPARSQEIRELRDGTPYGPGDDVRRDPTRQRLNQATPPQVYHRLKKPGAPGTIRNPYALWKRSPWALEAYVYNQGLRAQLFPKSNAPRTARAAIDQIWNPDERARRNNATRIAGLKRKTDRGDLDSHVPPDHGRFRPFDHFRRGILATASFVRDDDADAVYPTAHRVLRQRRSGRSANAASAANQGWFNLGILAYFHPSRFQPRPGNHVERAHHQRGTRNRWNPRRT